MKNTLLLMALVATLPVQAVDDKPAIPAAATYDEACFRRSCEQSPRDFELTVWIPDFLAGNSWWSIDTDALQLTATDKEGNHAVLKCTSTCTKDTSLDMHISFSCPSCRLVPGPVEVTGSLRLVAGDAITFTEPATLTYGQGGTVKLGGCTYDVTFWETGGIQTKGSVGQSRPIPPLKGVFKLTAKGKRCHNVLRVSSPYSRYVDLHSADRFVFDISKNKCTTLQIQGVELTNPRTIDYPIRLHTEYRPSK